MFGGFGFAPFNVGSCARAGKTTAKANIPKQESVLANLPNCIKISSLEIEVEEIDQYHAPIYFSGVRNSVNSSVRSFCQNFVFRKLTSETRKFQLSPQRARRRKETYIIYHWRSVPTSRRFPGQVGLALLGLAVALALTRLSLERKNATFAERKAPVIDLPML